ncbi:MAG TPA: TonB-dependent receptor [Candidatus Angelobacter sp.]|nr:TonB-dependent receptor [Candidatus Angelobacter sp.]
MLIRVYSWLIGFLFVAVLHSSSLSAQSFNASVTGRILDPGNAVVAGAEVTVINIETRVRYTGRTNEDGIYLVSDIQPGIYLVEISKPGFKVVLKPDVALHIESVVALNFTLTFGSISESITVLGGAPVVNTESSSMGSIIEGRQVTELPLNGRNFTQLALLTPGVTRGAYGDNASGGGSGTNTETFRNSESGSAALSVNGLRPQANNFILDGLDNNESLVNTIAFFPPAEAIQEFRVSTSVAPAQFGRAGGAIVETSIRSGTNDIHGSAFEFLRNSALDANDAYFGTPNPLTGKVAKLPFRRNQFGGTLGLPVVKNKLFLFLDYQGLRSERSREPEFVTVPTILMRKGDFSELLGTGLTSAPDPRLTGCANVTTVNGAIYDPLTCAPFMGNLISPDRANPVGLNYLNAFPLPNVPGRIQNDYEAQRREAKNFDDFDLRLDQALSAKDLVFARYSFAQDRFALSSQFSALPSGFGSGTTPTDLHAIAAGHTRAFSTNVVNDIRFGYTRDFFAFEPPFGNQRLAADLGIPNANRTPFLGGGALIGDNSTQLQFTGDGGPYAVHESTWQGNDNLAWTTGHHTFRSGLNVIHRQVNFFQGNFAKGFFAIGGINGVGTGRFTGYDVSELLAGFTDYEIGPGATTFATASWETGYYVQDDLRLTRRLNVNLGVRYELDTYPVEDHNLQSNFDLASGSLLLPGQNGLPRSLVRTDRNNWAPRIGFAYDLGGHSKTVVRGGYGIFYFLDRGGVGNQLSNNPDFNGAAVYQAVEGLRFTLSGSAPNGTNNSHAATSPLPVAAPVASRTAPRNASVIAVLPDNQISRVQQWNLQLERQFGGDTALNIAYVGARSDHLMTWFNLNNQISNTPIGTSVYAGTGLTVNVGAAAGAAYYDGLQVHLNQRFARDLQYTISYSWSHTLDNSNGPFSVTGGNGRIFIQPGGTANLAANYGNSDQDQRHLLTLSTIYELPFGQGRRFGPAGDGFLSSLTGGWQWNSIVTVGTGTPFDVFVNGNPSNRPDYQGGANNGIQGLSNGGLRWISFNSFAVPPVNASGVFTRPGTLARNFFHGPGVQTWDMSLFKTFELNERVKLQFRTEAYNVLNTPQFTNPDANVSDGPNNFGIIRATRAFSERQIQFALRILF